MHKIDFQLLNIIFILEAERVKELVAETIFSISKMKNDPKSISGPVSNDETKIIKFLKKPSLRSSAIRIIMIR